MKLFVYPGRVGPLASEGEEAPAVGKDEILSLTGDQAIMRQEIGGVDPRRVQFTGIRSQQAT